MTTLHGYGEERREPAHGRRFDVWRMLVWCASLALLGAMAIAACTAWPAMVTYTVIVHTSALLLVQELIALVFGR